jgi:hypothetical protein
MKLSCMQLLLIACLCAAITPALAQTSSNVTPASKDSSGDSLPYAPSAVSKQAPAAPSPISTPIGRDKYFMLVNGLMFSSSITNVELTRNCLIDRACSAIPSPLRSRGALYSIGLTADVAVGMLGYRLKNSEHRWWWVPAAAVTAGNIIYSIHAVHYTR